MVCGDFDGNGTVGARDRTVQTENWTGAMQGGGTKQHEDGDCDGDGDVDTLDQTGMLQNWSYPIFSGLADLIYDPTTETVS